MMEKILNLKSELKVTANKKLMSFTAIMQFERVLKFENEIFAEIRTG